jgi:two-component SAPR family response regulator
MNLILKQFENILLDTLNQIEQISIMESNNKEEIIELLENLKCDIKKLDLDIPSNVIDKIQSLEKTLR